MSNPPMSVRITRFLLWCSLIGAIVLLIFSSLNWLFLSGGRRIDSSTSWTHWVPAVLGAAIAYGIMVFALRGIYQRKPYGRWLSVAFLMIWIVGAFEDFDESGAIRIVVKAFSQGQLPPIKGRLIDDFPYDTSYPIYLSHANLARYVLKELLSLLLLGVLPGVLSIRLITAQAVQDFFRQG
jgi:hypothetical protein